MNLQSNSGNNEGNADELFLKAVGKAQDCPDCNGTGILFVQIRDDKRAQAQCPKCQGTGKGEVAIERILNGEADRDEKPWSGNFKYQQHFRRPNGV